MSRERDIWYDMRRRCDNPKRPGFENYGGRGISYDKRWESFEEFWKDMSSGYTNSSTLERTDVNGDYTQDNCEWVSMFEQQRNKRRYSSNSLGVANCYLCEERGVPYLRARITKPDGKRVVKSQSLFVRPLEEALLVAQQWLEERKQEYGYKTGHGT